MIYLSAMKTSSHALATPPTSCQNSGRKLKLTSIGLLAFVNLICISHLTCPSLQQAHSGHAHKHEHGQHHHHHHHHSIKDEPAPARVDPYQNIKILIPNLPPAHYQFWLRNHPRAAKIFEDVCARAGPRVLDIQDLAHFQQLHSNLSFEQPRYLADLSYGKSVLGVICSKIRDVHKSCWGYENKCQEIYLMPECRGTSYGAAKSEQDQKIAWFSQADFGYILDRRKEMSKFCAPDKKVDPSSVSSLECTKHFTTCRGNNLYVQFNTSNLVQGLGQVGLLAGDGVEELGGFACDLQSLRIKEESGRQGKHQSWYAELKDYKLVDALKPQETSELVFDKQVFFVKVDSASNLDDYLSTFINLYATLHLNNRFSDDVQIVLWAKRLPRGKTFEQLWYAFSRYPPTSIGQLNGRKVLFKKFIFAMPPKMVDGLHTDKQLIDGCAKSGLYHAFHKHVIHRLNTPQLYDLNFHQKTQGRLLRVAILSRSSSEFRTILNEKELEDAIRAHSKSTFVQVLKYNSMDFGHVLLSVLNSDIVIGLHGAGLAYSLFLPDWAGLIELYDCKKSRYSNLARQRGISYYKPTEEEVAAGFVKRVQVPDDSSEWAELNRSRLLDHDEFNKDRKSVV